MTENKNALTIAADNLGNGSQFSETAEIFRMIGHHEAFGAVATRTTAAWAECLKRLKDTKQYKAMGMTWNEFCPKYLSISTDTADRIIGNLREFGDIYFLLSEVTKLSRDQFRAIQGQIRDGKLQIGEDLVDINKSNQDRIREFIENCMVDAQMARGELAKSKEAESKAKKKAELATKAAEASRNELLDLKSQDEKLFPNASEAMRMLLKAQTYAVRAAELIEAVDNTMTAEMERGAVKGLVHYIIEITMKAGGEDPTRMFADMLEPRDLVKEAVVPVVAPATTKGSGKK